MIFNRLTFAFINLITFFTISNINFFIKNIYNFISFRLSIDRAKNSFIK